MGQNSQYSVVGAVVADAVLLRVPAVSMTGVDGGFWPRGSNSMPKNRWRGWFEAVCGTVMGGSNRGRSPSVGRAGARVSKSLRMGRNVSLARGRHRVLSDVVFWGACG